MLTDPVQESLPFTQISVKLPKLTLKSQKKCVYLKQIIKIADITFKCCNQKQYFDGKARCLSHVYRYLLNKS